MKSRGEEAQRFDWKKNGIFPPVRKRVADIVKVRDIPMRAHRRPNFEFIAAAYALPKGQGISIFCDGPKHGNHKASGISYAARQMGMPVATRVRRVQCAKGGGQEWKIFIFKKSDLTLRRNGRSAR